ncbi:hypothetical protein BO70DRAFT_231564 [Aspergillus heteromorphus CBS 117.55]|uniref:Uncharacterized protein n=1 Tax=Aspergillus heteromorphus CBS 117.55 TaxID=1448321 RepID=A0A317WEQ7_9EURO|nr:uncharacterized protein BO70DRAFT_231564 [Aspergillus heteromorphus CBS 117.55]PWY84956.1 hypothetical protein BO70DRAFT_231564 [Aspergillus heteromorphus CBS 117.55]
MMTTKLLSFLGILLGSPAVYLRRNWDGLYTLARISNNRDIRTARELRRPRLMLQIMTTTLKARGIQMAVHGSIRRPCATHACRKAPGPHPDQDPHDALRHGHRISQISQDIPRPSVLLPVCENPAKPDPDAEHGKAKLSISAGHRPPWDSGTRALSKRPP